MSWQVFDGNKVLQFTLDDFEKNKAIKFVRERYNVTVKNLRCTLGGEYEIHLFTRTPPKHFASIKWVGVEEKQNDKL